MPPPVYPAAHVHVNEPGVSAHVTWLGAQLCSPLAHSFTCAHAATPSPVYPSAHVQLNDPALLAHAASAWHTLLEHSSMSTHAVPSPVKPALHTHANEPGLLAHIASAAHELRPAATTCASASSTPAG